MIDLLIMFIDYQFIYMINCQAIRWDRDQSGREKVLLHNTAFALDLSIFEAVKAPSNELYDDCIFRFTYNAFNYTGTGNCFSHSIQQ